MHLDLLSNGPLTWIPGAIGIVGVVVMVWGIALAMFALRFKRGFLTFLLGIGIFAGSLWGLSSLGHHDNVALQAAVKDHYGVQISTKTAHQLLQVKEAAFAPDPSIETQAGTAWVYGTQAIRVEGKTVRATLYRINDRFILGLATPTSELRELPQA